MRSRPTFAAAALACAVTLLASGTASAGNHPVPTPDGPTPPDEPIVEGPVNIDSIAVSVRPDGGSPLGIEIGFDRTSRTESGAKPAPANRFVFLFDKSIRFNPEKFPTCARADFEAGGPDACPPGSKVGSGQAVIYPDTSAEVAVFNTRYDNGMRGVLITIPATGAVLENTFETVVDPYRADYRWASDELLPSPLPPLERSATTRFQVSFGATTSDATGTHSFVESFAPPRHELRFGVWSRFVTGQVVVPTARADRPAWNRP
ncbi:hypothetical protein [Saccharopolyspora sp. 5N708]|uniref:hypothetical protein n=1 Tax=Saccharopolyspora sp. 5N708 TaxID=3457424 RepID=UPI003FCEFC2A